MRSIHPLDSAALAEARFRVSFLGFNLDLDLDLDPRLPLPLPLDGDCLIDVSISHELLEKSLP